jgi:hypothetical protein
MSDQSIAPEIVEVAARAAYDAEMRYQCGDGGIWPPWERTLPENQEFYRVPVRAAIYAADEARGLREQYGIAARDSDTPNTICDERNELEIGLSPADHIVCRLVSDWASVGGEA